MNLSVTISVIKLIFIGLRVLVLWRFVYTNGRTVPDVMPAMPKFMIPLAKKLWVKAAHGQGMGRHTEAEAREIGIRDLRAMSTFLGIPG